MKHSTHALIILTIALGTLPCATQANRQAVAQEASGQQQELLTTAFRIASKIPTQPHIKDRSRQQEEVVNAAIELGRTDLALVLASKIENYRRGVAFSNIAFHMARSNKDASKLRIERYLAIAEQEARNAEEGWRRDRINVNIGRTQALLGQSFLASQQEKDVVDSEKGKIAQVIAMTADETNFDEQMKSLAQIAANESYDIKKNALYAYVELFNRFYEDSARRSQVEDKIRSTWKAIPAMDRILIIETMTDHAVAHADQAKALSLVDDCMSLIKSHRWPPRYAVRLLARIAQQRAEAGDSNQALIEAQYSLKNYELYRDKIIDIDRAATLLPLAEAYQSMNQLELARSIYGRAIDEATINPNARPTAEDLSLICRSMALNAVQPDEALWARIREIEQGLKAPW